MVRRSGEHWVFVAVFLNELGGGVEFLEKSSNLLGDSSRDLLERLSDLQLGDKKVTWPYIIIPAS